MRRSGSRGMHPSSHHHLLCEITPVKTLELKRTEFQLSHFQTATMLRDMVDFNPPAQVLRLVGEGVKSAPGACVFRLCMTMTPFADYGQSTSGFYRLCSANPYRANYEFANPNRWIFQSLLR